MSAFMQDKAHVDALLTAGLAPSLGRSPLRWLVPEPVNDHAYTRGQPWGPEALTDYDRRARELTPQTAGRVGAMLMAENRRSVDHRYDETELDPSEAYIFEPYPRSSPALDPVKILHAIDGYEYQACEHPEWRTSEAHAFCDALRRAMIAQLPGYSDADTWAISDRAAPLEPEPEPEPLPRYDRADAIRLIREHLKRRSGKVWRVYGHRGTAWGWITIRAPKARSLAPYGSMTEADCAELARLLDMDRPAHCQGILVSPDARAWYVAAARGET